MAKALEGRVALVTGGARGIGKAVCLRLAAEGAKVAMADILPEVAEASAKEFRDMGYDALAVTANVAKVEDADNAIKSVIDKYGKIDILVNCAGITKDNLMLRMSEQDWDAVIAVNLKGTYNMIKAASRPMMKARYGKIVNVSSVVGRAGNAGQVNYSASKAGVIGVTKSVAKELGSRNIYVNAVAPGFIETDMTKNLPEESKKAFVDFIALKRAGKPEDVANVIYFLCSPDSDYVTGQVINVCGGFLM